eukprot:COSAG06_NODE_45473_length_354_cov_1.219608_1_plen_43_part_01
MHPGGCGVTTCNIVIIYIPHTISSYSSLPLLPAQTNNSVFIYH